MKSTTPTKSKPKTLENPQQLQEEFNKRAINLFYSMYTTPSVDELMNFPPVQEQPPTEGAKLKAKIEFHSGVCDYKLRRKVQNSVYQSNSVLVQLGETVERQPDIKNTQIINAEEIFAPEKAQRSEKPLYLQNQEEDEQNYEKSIHISHKPLNIPAIEKEYKQRLKKSEETGKARCMRRYRFIKKTEKEHRDFVSSLSKPRSKAQ
ncbi:hypothetical protein TVAG_051570 [Trichomonas vaginalis G3]|uniref:Uncharacterized protein n=1 Tax=Trichomonas vaginalis (strain ATCC PRA-98 / G3) TaxID=412133 RepID=A2EZ92_TRIV3|nr:hypothetical protein TVAGG3_0807680 [Trichomonas vaginalis G3]EAY02025.1 hypothetical protein TVAG_051570 [Trichomonas vaginalis G3]KAI5496980.1 hypothetical protein TVAGG3_0807680 [Trichomonas vaginalis G3]|eukprot:XP_001330485.1 hypothetical protein [Trichomonas vaginalis G3]